MPHRPSSTSFFCGVTLLCATSQRVEIGLPLRTLSSASDNIKPQINFYWATCTRSECVIWDRASNKIRSDIKRLGKICHPIGNQSRIAFKLDAILTSTLWVEFILSTNKMRFLHDFCVFAVCIQPLECLKRYSNDALMKHLSSVLQPWKLENSGAIGSLLTAMKS